MNCGSRAMIQKPRFSRPSGICLVLHTQRRHGKVAARSRPCQLCFLIWKVLSIISNPSRPINKEYYLNVLHGLSDETRWKWLQLRATGDWQLHHNTPAHASHLTAEIFDQISSHPVTQPHYSPDLVPCSFFLALTKTKITLERKRFQTINEFQENMMGKLTATPKKDFARFWTVEEMLGELCEVPRCLLWRGLRCHCPMHNVSCIFFNKCLYFSYYRVVYFLDRTHIYPKSKHHFYFIICKKKVQNPHRILILKSPQSGSS